MWLSFNWQALQAPFEYCACMHSLMLSVKLSVNKYLLSKSTPGMMVYPSSSEMNMAENPLEALSLGVRNASK